MECGSLLPLFALGSLLPLLPRLHLEPGMSTNNSVLSVKRAYAAMCRFLENEYRLTKSSELGALLGLSLLEDGGTADPAAWGDWLIAVDKVLAGDDDISLKISSAAQRAR
jgi:hypothetical protein